MEQTDNNPFLRQPTPNCSGAPCKTFRQISTSGKQANWHCTGVLAEVSGPEFERWLQMKRCPVSCYANVPCFQFPYQDMHICKVRYKKSVTRWMYFHDIAIRRDALFCCDCRADLNACLSVPKQLLSITSQIITEARVLMYTVILWDRVSLVEWLSALILHAVLICKKICSVRHCPFVTHLEIREWEMRVEKWNCKTGPAFLCSCWLFWGVQLWLSVKHLKKYLGCNRHRVSKVGMKVP